MHPPQYRVCPDHSILLIQGEAPVILWPKVPAIVLYLLYGMLALTPHPPPCEFTSETGLSERMATGRPGSPSIPIPFRSPSIY